MDKLILFLRRIWARRHGRRATALDLSDICVRVSNDNLIRLRFAQEVRVKVLRQALSLQTKSELGNMLLFHNGELLQDEQRIGEFDASATGCIDLDLASPQMQINEGFVWRGDELYAFINNPVSEHAVEKSGWFYRQNQRDKPRRLRRLKELLPEVSLDGKAPVIMAFNSGFSSMFLNWVRSCDKNNISVRERAIIFPMDEESRGLAQNEGFSVCYDEKSDLLKTTGNSTVFGDEEFTKHMFFQNAIIQDMLELGCDFLFQDVDVVWLESPFEYFEANEIHDIEFMYDGANSFHAPLNANSGFIYFRNRPGTRHFWDIIYRNYDRVIQFRSQQSPLNKYLGLLHNRGLKINILPEEYFANGHLFYPEPEEISRLPDNPKVVHCSWTLNVEQKIKKYKNNDLWFLSDD